MTDTAGPRTEAVDRNYSAVQRWLDGFSDLSVRSKAAILLMMQERETAIEVKARLTRDQDAAVLAYQQVERALEKDQGNHDVDLRDMLRHTFRVLSDHSAAADDIRELVERVREAIERLWNESMWYAENDRADVSKASLRAVKDAMDALATQQPAEGGDPPLFHENGEPVMTPGRVMAFLTFDADTKQGRQVMADRDRLWQQYDVAKHRVYAPDQVAAARKAIEDEIRERVEKPWTRLQDELRAHKAWYRNPPTAPDISAHVGMDSERRFWGGVWIDGDPLTRDEWGDDPLVEDGDSPQQVIDGLIASIRQYRVDRERERAEMEAEEADTEQGDK
jgi:hypothetical protein